MKKWSKGILIFGISATILGACSLMAGLASNGFEQVLTLSNRAVYAPKELDKTIQEKVEKLDIELNKHELTIVESVDDQVHLSYFNRMTGEKDFDYAIKDGVLQLTDTDVEESRELGSSLDLILSASQSITGRRARILIAIPKSQVLKDVKVRMQRINLPFNMTKVAAEHADIETASYYNGFHEVTLRGGSVKTDHALYFGDGELSNLQLESEEMITLDQVTIKNQVTANTAGVLDLYLKAGDSDQTLYQLRSLHSSIMQLSYEEDYGYDYEHAEELGSQYALGQSKAANKLTAQAASDIQLFQAQGN